MDIRHTRDETADHKTVTVTRHHGTTAGIARPQACNIGVILSKIPDTDTFAQLGELVGYSHEWVRQRLVQHPERLYKIGPRYQVPKGTAEEFVKSVLV